MKTHERQSILDTTWPNFIKEPKFPSILLSLTLPVHSHFIFSFSAACAVSQDGFSFL